MTRKALVILSIIVVTVLVLAACGGEDPTPTPAPTATAVPTAAPEPTATEPPPAVEPEATEAPQEEAAAEAEATAEPEAEATAEPEAEAEATAEPEAEAEATAEPEAEAAAAVTAAVLTVEAARPVYEIVNEKDPVMPSISPDGSHLAWIQSTKTGLFRSVGQVCFFTFENAAKSCYDAPEEFYGYPYQLYWLPDSSGIVVTENPITLGYESDVWVVNFADGAFANRTDDGVAGSWVTLEQPTLDYLPMPSASDGMIYFWRGVPLGDYQYSIGIFRVSPVEGEAELVRDLSTIFSTQVPVFNQDTLSMDSISSISPDGTTVAVSMSDLAAETTDDAPPANSIWLIPVADPTAEITQVMSPQDLQKGTPAYLAVPAAPVGLSWTADSAAIVVNTFANDTHAPLQVYYYVDVAAGASTPVVDFTTTTSHEELYAVPESGVPLRYYSPWTASLASDNLSLLMYSDLGGVGTVFQAMFPPDGTLPPSIATADTPPLSGATRSSRASDGKVVMYGVLFTTVPQ